MTRHTLWHNIRKFDSTEVDEVECLSYILHLLDTHPGIPVVVSAGVIGRGRIGRKPPFFPRVNVRNFPAVDFNGCVWGVQVVEGTVVALFVFFGGVT